MSATFDFPSSVPELTEGQVHLRELTEQDIPSWFTRATDAESADLAGDPVPESIQAGAAWLKRHRDRFREGTGIRWAIVVPAAPESVGTVGLTIRSREQRIADFGIVVARAWWGRGVGTSAARLAIRYGFETLGLAEIQAEVLQRNFASMRLLEKVGFDRLPPAGAANDPDPCFAYSLQRPRFPPSRG